MSGGMGGGEAGVPDDLLTTKGDTHGYTTENARVPIGSDTQVLTADSTEALGLKWADASAGGTVLLEEIVMGTPAATLSSTVTLDKSLYGSFIVTGNFSPTINATTTLRMRVNNNSAAGQLVNGSAINGATQTDFQISDTSFRISDIGFTLNESTNVNLIFNQSSINRGYFMAFGYSAWEGAGTNTRLDHLVNSDVNSAITSVDFFFEDGSLFETGNWLTITGVSR